jgi:hypothetical protein
MNGGASDSGPLRCTGCTIESYLIFDVAAAFVELSADKIALHHKLFDPGAFTLSIEDVPRILLSRDVHGGDFARQMLIDLHGKRIRQPQDRAWYPSPEFIAWHHQEVFKGESRAV